MASSTLGMRRLAGGMFQMGSDRHYSEEAPSRRVAVDPFWIDEHPVTNALFAHFVAATEYETQAERPVDPVAFSAAFPGVSPQFAQPGSLVFRPSSGPVDLRDPSQWWTYCIGADWRHPLGPSSTIEGLDDHPVVHVTAADAEAYAKWVGKSLPTEAEWEFAARGGLDAKDYAWGDELTPGGMMLANFWQGEFPWRNTLDDGYERTSPVGAYPPNDFGLHDLIGNVWEWTADWYAVGRPGLAAKPCCAPRNPRGATEEDSPDPDSAGPRIGRRVIKGGSYLCAPSYCQRYRPAARSAQALDTSTGHIGIRCVRRLS